MYHSEENILGVGTPDGVLVYTIDWTSFTINSYNTWFNNLHKEVVFKVTYLDSHLITFYASNEEKVIWDIRFGSLSLPLDENILSNYKHDYEPICTFNIVLLDYVNAYCLYETGIFVYQVSNKASVKFPLSDETYTFAGFIEYCYPHTWICD